MDTKISAKSGATHLDMASININRFKFVRQRDAMQCGVACLYMVARYWRIKCSLLSIERICHPSKDGISMKGILDAAKSIGLTGHAVRISLDDLCRCSLPAILHWNQNHFVVLYKITSGRNNIYHVADPGKGKLRISRDEFRQHWIYSSDGEMPELGIAMTLKPSSLSSIPSDSENNDKRSFKFLFRYLIKYRKYFIQISAGLLLGCVLQLILPFMMQAIVDIGIHYNDIKLIWLILLGELMIVIGRTATDFIRQWLLLHISMRINISLVSDFFIKLLKLPMGFFDTKHLGDILQRIGDHSRVQNFLTGQTLNIIFTTLNFIVFGFVLFLYDPVIFAVFIVGSAFYGIWMMLFLRQRRILDYELFEQQAINQNQTYQFITSIQEIKLQNCERRHRWAWEDSQADLFRVTLKSMKLQQTQEAGSIFINEIKNIFITIIAATSVIDGHLSLGTMLAVQYIIGQLNSPISQLLRFIYSIQDIKISLERINEIHERENEASISNLAEFNYGESIILRNVNFKYDLHSVNKTINNVSFEIPEGKVTAIVGTSGSGKSTLIKLILGYYPVISGCVEISGRDISEYNLQWWRRQCGVVMQDGIIFSESIARNIAVGDDEIDEVRLENAARLTNIHDFVMGLPLGYHTKIGADGMGLSHGQKQRILIARAVYKRPRFIFLDEATNALDASNEKEIVENLEKFFRGRTVIVVAHRLSTVKNADQIIVLDNGMVIESGVHSSLIKHRGAYYNLVKNQLELGN